MSEIKCPIDLNNFILEHPFENTFSSKDCEIAQAYGDCYHCFASAIAKRDREIRESARPKGEWIQLKDNVYHFMCSVCDDADYYESGVPKFCPECGARMRRTVANKCGSCIHDKEKSEPRTCPKCRIFDRYEPYKKGE